MKKIFTLILLTTGFGASAQYVGVNTVAPKATLDVVGKPTDAVVPDGFIPPRLTRSQLIAKTGYGANQKGAIVYVTDLSGATNSSTTDVTQIGYFVFDGTAWKAFAMKKYVAAYVDQGEVVTLGNLNVRLAAVNERSLDVSFTNAVAAVNGASRNVYASSAGGVGGRSASQSGYMRQNGGDGANYWTAGTWRRWHAGADFGYHGSTQQILINDATNKISYRVTLIVGYQYFNNFISIEQL